MQAKGGHPVGFIHHEEREEPSAAAPQPKEIGNISRKDAKALSKKPKTFENLASWREEYPNPKFPTLAKLRKLRKISTIVVHAFSQTALEKRGSPCWRTAANRKPNYLPQRCLGAKLMNPCPSSRANARDLKRFLPAVEMTSLPDLASLRLCGRHIRIRESSITGKFAQARHYDKHVGLSFWIAVRRVRIFLIINFVFGLRGAHRSVILL